MIEQALLYVGLAGLVIGVLTAIFSAKLRARMVETIRLFPRASRGEQACLAFGLILLAAGPLLVGPIDEIVALALIGRTAKRITARFDNLQ